MTFKPSQQRQPRNQQEAILSSGDGTAIRRLLHSGELKHCSKFRFYADQTTMLRFEHEYLHYYSGNSEEALHALQEYASFVIPQIKDSDQSPFIQADLSNADCQAIYFAPGSILKGIRFEGANLTRADFSGVDLTDAVFAQAILNNCTVSSSTQFVRASFQRARIDTSFCCANLTEADFSESLIGIGIFDDARLEGARFHRIQVNGALQFHNALLAKASFRAFKGDGISFMGADLTQATFTDVMLKNADFRKAKLVEARFV